MITPLLFGQLSSIKFKFKTFDKKLKEYVEFNKKNNIDEFKLIFIFC